ncbi:MAG: hypothetical protein AB9834_16385 [Lentimicrobium sp.]
MNNFEDHELDLNPNIKVIKTEYSPIGRLLISKNYIAVKQYIESKKSLKQKVRELLRRVWRASIFYRLMFPDKFIFEHGKIMQEMKKLKQEQKQFDAIIISASPFSLLKLVRKIRKLFPEAKYIYDTGDPFYGNSGTELIKPLRTTFARRFEQRYLPDIDTLVVMSKALKSHYLRHFGDILNEKRIHVIDQGYQPFYNDFPAKGNRIPGEMKLLYAGGLYKGLREPYGLYEAIRNYNAGKVSLRIFGNIHKDFLPEESERFYYGGSIESAQLYKEYQDCDATVFIDNKSGVQVPGKVLELTGIKRPILFIYDNPSSPTIEYIEGNLAIVKCRNNMSDISEALNKLDLHYDSFLYTETNKEYTWPRLADRYLKEIL